jgi:chemotaxis protein methyltransferase CheR
MSTPVIELKLFKELVKQRCGLMFEGSGEDNLRRAIVQRLQANRIHSASIYYATLLGDEQEFHELVTLLTINETYFFRDPEQLAFLCERLIPRLLSERGEQRPLQILSIGCSTGEEPYSIAIALIEKYGLSARSLCSIMAADIDYQALVKARTASYNQYSFRTFPESLKKRYFIPTGDANYLLSPEVRSLVEFQHLNILSDALPQAFQHLDIILFRNVSIYFDEATRRDIQTRLTPLMNEPAYLLTASTETLANDFGILQLVEEQGHFYFSKDSSRPNLTAPPPLTPAANRPTRPDHFISEPLPGNENPAVPWRPTIEEAYEWIRNKQYRKALMVIDQLRTAIPTDLRPLLLGAYAHMQMREFPPAKLLAKEALEQDRWSTEAYVLLGLMAKWQGDEQEATQCFKQAVYCRHECWPAHYYLGELYRAARHIDQAMREYKIALRQIEADPDPDGGLLLPLGFSSGEVHFLCQHYGHLMSNRDSA